MAHDASISSPDALKQLAAEQERRNAALLRSTPLLGDRVESAVLPLRLDVASGSLDDDMDLAFSALEKKAAAIAVKSLISLARVNDLDHLGGGLELIPSLLMTLSIVDYEKRHFAIEHGHTSIGYYAALAALGFLDEERVIHGFRRSLDIAGHVSWVPGGTQLCSGRLGVMMPVGAGLALGLRAKHGREALVLCHCGDAGWISGQALDGFTGASLHGAPIVFIMHRNGIQLSGPTARIMPKDPRPIISSLAIRILEIPSLHDRRTLCRAYAEAYRFAQQGQPAMIYPVGYTTAADGTPMTLEAFGRMYGITAETEAFAVKHGVRLATPIWVPGSLMSFRDVHAMLECLCYVNNLPGGETHHDGGMKGRDGDSVLANSMLRLTPGEQAAIDRLKQRPPRRVTTLARPPHGTPNLTLHGEDLKDVQLPGTDKWTTARAGSEAAYVAIAKKYPDKCFFVSCDLNPSTRVGKAAAAVPAGHQFEMSIQEQAAALMTDGLSFAGREPQLNVFATFTAFIEGIAREGFEFWRYQRNLTGVNEGLNVLMHLSHVGACTGRDHFSGWSLDWVNLALGYMPFLRRFYAPADARAAFLAVKDAASARGGHIVAIPRDNLPVLTKTDSREPLWNADDEWTPVTTYRQRPGATTAMLAFGAPSFLAGGASDQVFRSGVPVDVYVVNGFPLPDAFVRDLAGRYRRIFTIEDGLIGSRQAGRRGFAAFVCSELIGTDAEVDHFGIVDPRTAPSDYYLQVWEHFGMTEEAIVARLLGRA